MLSRIDLNELKYKPELLWESEYDYLPELVGILNPIVRRLMQHKGMNFEKALLVIYGDIEIYTKIADWEGYGWETLPQEYYERYAEKAGLKPFPANRKLEWFPYDEEHEAFILALETARRNLKEPNADVFWFMNESRLMYIWDTYGKTGSSVEYLTKTMEGLCLKYKRKD